jgi:hypothetical protein
VKDFACGLQPNVSSGTAASTRRVLTISASNSGNSISTNVGIHSSSTRHLRQGIFP